MEELHQKEFDLWKIKQTRELTSTEQSYYKCIKLWRIKEEKRLTKLYRGIR